MDARAYAYTYLLLSAVYVAGCLQYMNSLGRSASLARRLRPGENDEPAVLDDDTTLEQAKAAVRGVLGIDSAAFACAVLPVAYVAVSGLLGNILSRNTGAATTVNPLWLFATFLVVAAHLYFTVRIGGFNSRLKALDRPVLTRSFVDRQTRHLMYYRTFIVLVTAFNVVNLVSTVVNISAVTSLPFVV